jgi:hypothetical protein
MEQAYPLIIDINRIDRLSICYCNQHLLLMRLDSSFLPLLCKRVQGKPESVLLSPDKVPQGSWEEILRYSIVLNQKTEH